MNKKLSFLHSVLTVAIVGLVLGINGNIDAISIDDDRRQKDNSAAVAQNLNCPNLDESLVPVRHPVRASLNRKFRAEGRAGEINNVVRLGNYGAAYWWTRSSATPVAIQFKGNGLGQAVTTSSVVNVLQSWGASRNTAQCIHLLLNESGI
ncbi:hypothetical protein [Microseira wollei]|uniref:Uncharacterized protein n=1 Tax=Microseira wollei NIES-4236 TaxID=2530354 RepID=A0AAV3XC89_9CYAN|nr:hypothetical protein [Microseira wollei]GET39036.1 hypothetical protein MiSe_37970 [Microseira wollei NIES-4236]